jgi:glycosyltransferase involved in cell wall biosynthesis
MYYLQVKKLKVVIGIPAFNEEKNIAVIIAKIQKLSYDVIVCNDGSSDMTGEIAEKMGITIINHSRNLGYGTAIRSIFLKANELNYDILVTFDADGQHRIKDVKSVINPLINNQADIVIGSRFSEHQNLDMPKYREIGIKAITKLANFSTENKIKDSQSGFRAYNKKALQEIVPSESGMGVSTEILIKANKEKFKIVEVPIKILYEGNTSTHNPTSHGINVILSTLKFISIERPISFYGLPGLILFGIGLFFILWTIQAFSETREIITNISLIGIGSITLGMILIVTAIILYAIVSVVREKR